MTQKEKAKAYDEVREKIAIRFGSNVADEIFSQFEMSDDERIRKELLDFCKNKAENFPNDPKYKNISAWISWLEKQGQKPQGKSALEAAKEEKVDDQNCVKPADKIQIGKKYKCIASPRYSTFIKGFIYIPQDKFLCSLMNFCSDCFELIEDGEQKPTDKTEPKFKVGQIITDGKETVIVSELLDDGSIRVDTKSSGDCWFDIDVNEADKWRLVENPAEWSEEDEKIALSIEQVMNCASLLNIVPEKEDKIRTWLKSIKDRVQPQNKWKESLATADLENSLCDMQDGFSDTSYEYRILGEAIEFIRCTEPKPQWKPSDEQMMYLSEAIDMVTRAEKFSIVTALKELIEQLKKLREE